LSRWTGAQTKQTDPTGKFLTFASVRVFRGLPFGFRGNSTPAPALSASAALRPCAAERRWNDGQRTAARSRLPALSL